MVRSELLQKLCNLHPNIFRKDMQRILEIIFFEIIDALYKGENVEIRGFGTFKVVERAPRTGRTPRTGSEVKIDSRKAPTFKASKELRARIENENLKDKGPGEKKDAVWQEEKAA